MIRRLFLFILSFAGALLLAENSSPALAVEKSRPALTAKNSQRLLLAQDDTLFDDSDLEDIEGTDLDEDLDDEFSEFDEKSAQSNFVEEDFEIIEEEEEEPGDSSSIEDEGPYEDDYELISEDPDYEIISDAEIEGEFEEGAGEPSADEEGFDSQSDEGSQQALEELEEEDLNLLDYELISDDPDYEIISDEEIEEEFEEGADEASSQDPLMDSEEIDGSLEDFDEEQDPTSGIQDLEIPDEEAGDDPLLEEEGFDNGAAEDGLPIEDGGLADESADEEFSTAEQEAADDGVLNFITNIRYIAEKDQIAIDCSEPVSYTVRSNQENQQYIVEILQAELSDNLNWPYVLRDFNTNFGLIKADQKNADTVRVIVQMKEGAEFPVSTLTEDSNQILIGYGEVSGYDIVKGGGRRADGPNILPSKTLEDLYFGKIEFSGSPLSFHVIDAPVKQVLRFISEESNLNMVIDESVGGTVTLKLEDVPWDQALYTIFKVKSLGYTRDGNVITILPLDKIEERTKKLREIADRQKSFSAYETKVIPVNYGNLSDIEGKVKEFSTQKTDYAEGGRIIIHEESNTFVVIDTPKAIEKIESLVQYLDKPPKQVMVEAKIVDVTESFSRGFGLRWSMSGNVPVSIPAGFEAMLNRINLNWNAASAEGQGASSLSVSGLPVIGNLGASLALAESDGQAQVVSSPKVVVISGESASITRNAPIQVTKAVTTGFESNTITEAQESADIQIGMDVKPTVTSAGSVFLEVSVQRSDPGVGESYKVDRTATTKVLVKNGQTIVIGGIYGQDIGNQNNGLPFLKDLPFLGFLFKQNEITRIKSELLVFITPRILDAYE